MLADSIKLKELDEKYSTGNYICVVENRFGGTGYFIKENDEFKENWNYTLIHIKHKEILEAHLNNSSVAIVILVQDSVYQMNLDFIETYDERNNYKIMELK
jgi:hypothetical protein